MGTPPYWDIGEFCVAIKNKFSEKINKKNFFLKKINQQFVNIIILFYICN